MPAKVWDGDIAAKCKRVRMLTKPAFGFLEDPFSWANRPAWSPVQWQEKDSDGETIPTDDLYAVLANCDDIKSCGMRGHVLEWRAWPIRVITAPGIRGGIGKTALRL